MTSNDYENEEPLLNSSSKKPKFTAVNDDSENEEDQDPGFFVSNALGKKKKS